MRAPAGIRLLGRASAFTGRKALPTPLGLYVALGGFMCDLPAGFLHKQGRRTRAPPLPHPAAFTKSPENTGFTEHLTPEHPAQPASVIYSTQFWFP